MIELENVKTSIIIPVYNTEEYLEACIESVLAQTQKEIEIILVDDGSTDGSREIIKAYEAKFHSVKAVYQANQKLGAARNAGVKAASGKYLYFLDSDDYISMELCEKCFQMAETKSLDFVMFDAETFVEEDTAGFRDGSAEEKYGRSMLGIGDGVYSGVDYWRQFYSQRGIYSNAYLVYINSDFFRRNQLLFEPGVYYEDMDWSIRLYFCAQRTAYIPQKLYYRRIHMGSIMTVQYNDIHLKSSVFMCRKLAKMLLEEKQFTRQEIILPVWESMNRRFADIFACYCQQGKLERIHVEAKELCQSMLSVWADFPVEKEIFRTRILLVVKRIAAGLKESGQAISDLDSWLEQCKWQMVADSFYKFPLGQKDKVVGIYGTGMICDRFLELYQRQIGDIKAMVFFLDTYQKSGGYYKTYPLYNVKDIGKMDMDAILIASNRYRQEMADMARAYCPSGTDIIFIPELLSILYR